MGVDHISNSVPDPPETKPKRVTVDENAGKIFGELWWVAIGMGSILLTLNYLDGMALIRRAFLHRLVEKRDLPETTFLGNDFGSQIDLNRSELSGRRDYTDQNLIEKWF